MSENIVDISDLYCYNNAELERITIKASVSIRSIRHGTNRHAYFYMDLRDGSGDITAVAYADNEPCDNQLHRIRENRTYLFTNFTLENSNKRYTSITDDKEIVLNNNSVVKLCGNASKLEWPLVALSDVYDQDKTTFFNIVGMCTKVEATEVVLGELTRQVTLVDETRSEVLLNVWNCETSLFDELDLNCHPVFFVKDAKTYKYRGREGLRTSRYLKLLDPDDRRAAKIRRAILQGNQLTNSVQPDQTADRTVAKIQPMQQIKLPYCSPSDYTKKNQKYLTISELGHITKLSHVTVIATVTLISARFVRSENTSFNMDLRDASGDMVAVVYDDACAKFQDFIERNKTYSFTGFSLTKPNRKATSVQHPRVMILKHDGDIKLCGSAPKVEWPLSPLTVVHGEDKTEFLQAFGLFTEKEGRLMILVDQLGRELVLEVRDVNLALFEALDTSTSPVIFVKDATMSDRKHKGNRILVAGAYVELLEPDDPRALKVTESLGDGSS